MILKFRRKMKGISDFEYQIIYDDGSVSKILRSKYEGENKNEHISFVYESSTFEKNFKLFGYRRFKDTVTMDNVQITKGAEAQVGEEKLFVYYCIQKGTNIFKNEYYWQIDYLGNSYKCYEIGLGKKGTFYCILNENDTVAMIVKNPITKGNETQYDCYSYNNFPIEILVLFNVYIDLAQYYPSGTIFSNKTLHTWQKGLLNKYDETFISKIEQLEKNNNQ